MHTDVTEFIRTRPRLEERSGAVGQCRIATQDLLDALTDAGLAAAAVWVRGHRRELSDASPRAMAADRHMLLRLSDASFLDITRRQFEPDAPHPRYYGSESDLGSDWEEIDDGPPDGRVEDERWRRLP